MQDVVFALAFALLATHELDAMTQREWRLLYVLRALPEERARVWFVLLHVLLFAFLLWGCWHPDAAIRSGARLALAIFCVIHAGLHARLSGDTNYTFHAAHSKALIYGCAAAGALYALLWMG